ncbi:MAG: anti-sigma factor antagonist [Ruminococcus sp.]|nr:anti-sigma factor antagonist [Ruminococcus sp.]
MSTITEPIIIEAENDSVEVFLSGDIDHKNAAGLRNDIDYAIERHKPKVLTLNFAKVEFMDSSGIGLIMGRYKKLSAQGGRLILTGTSGTIKKVMKIAGVEKLAEIK